MDFKDLVQQRRSHRKFMGEEVSADDEYDRYQVPVIGFT